MLTRTLRRPVPVSWAGEKLPLRPQPKSRPGGGWLRAWPHDCAGHGGREAARGWGFASLMPSDGHCAAAKMTRWAALVPRFFCTQTTIVWICACSA